MIVNEDRFFLSHRADVALRAKAEGWDVVVVAGDTGMGNKIRGLGLDFIHLPMETASFKFKRDLGTVRFLISLFRKNRGAVVHLVGMKLILLGHIADRFASVRGVLNAVSGLGSFFGSEGRLADAAWRLLGRVVRGRNTVTLFQNGDDEKFFEKYNVATGRKAYLKGSGIDLNEFGYSPEPETYPLNILFTGRMLKEKGVVDFCDAAEILRPQLEGRVRFVLCGGLSAKPSALTAEEIGKMADGEYIQWVGQLDKEGVRKKLQECVMVVFPSYYREGLPKSLIEASAVGRPIITCNSVGCKDTVTDGENGFVVSPESPAELADSIRTLVNDPEMRRRMGISSRKRAEHDYSIDHVTNTHLDLYNSLYDAT